MSMETLNPGYELASVLLRSIRNSLKNHGVSHLQYKKALLHHVRKKSSQKNLRYVKTGKTLLTESSAYGRVVAIWRNDCRYLDEMGQPRILSFRGSNASLSSLLRSQGFKGIEDEAKKFLLTTSTIRKLTKDRYKLVRPYSPNVTKFDRTAYTHLEKSIDAYVGTFLHNLREPVEMLRLPEKKIEVLLPVAKHDLFRDFVQRQLTAVTYTIDDWLEAHASNKKSKIKSKYYAAGALLLAYSKAPKYSKKRAFRRQAEYLF